MWDKINWRKVGLFAGGVVFGTVGLKALFSKDAKKCYTHLTAAAKDINEDRKAAEEAVFEDTSKSYKEVESTEE